jgi:type II secretory pathway pseudopilin PulG
MVKAAIKNSCAGFTMTEILISAGIFWIVFMIIVIVLNATGDGESLDTASAAVRHVMK